ncbi:MAG TPA: Hsp20/alpha crystallin family protein [Polyangiaceae bacterium]|nr:Hsp20/alpha crystallin family protein [Polyangiaceae bacterium]
MLGRYSEWREWPLLGLRDLSKQFDELRREMDRAGFDFDRGGFGLGREVWPTVSVSDKGDAWELKAELPGLSEKDVELTANADSVTLRAERKLETPARHTVHRRERAAFRLARTFSLPTKIDPAKVEAALKNGVLTVTLAKVPEAQPRQIAVKAGS